jgi:hypothetical protein
VVNIDTAIKCSKPAGCETDRRKRRIRALSFLPAPADLKNVVAAAGGRYPEDTLVLIRQLSRPAMSHPS